jgi:hypothetical protein
MARSRHNPSLDLGKLKRRVDLGQGLRHKKAPLAKTTGGDPNKDFVRYLLHADTENGWEDQRKSMTDLAKDVGPIVDTFDKILVRYAVLLGDGSYRASLTAIVCLGNSIPE